jgi:hypothetical protein
MEENVQQEVVDDELGVDEILLEDHDVLEQQGWVLERGVDEILLEDHD